MNKTTTIIILETNLLDLEPPKEDEDDVYVEVSPYWIGESCFEECFFALDFLNFANWTYF